MSFCKYCKKEDHTIDFCPDIICKGCKQYGHAHWKCDMKYKDTAKPKNNRKTRDNRRTNGKKMNRKNLKMTKTIISKSERLITNNPFSTLLEYPDENEILDISSFMDFFDKKWSELC